MIQWTVLAGSGDPPSRRTMADAKFCHVSNGFLVLFPFLLWSGPPRVSGEGFSFDTIEVINVSLSRKCSCCLIW